MPDAQITPEFQRGWDAVLRGSGINDMSGQDFDSRIRATVRLKIPVAMVTAPTIPTVTLLFL